MLNITNIMGTLTAILTVVAGALSTVGGCAPGATDLSATCSASWLSPHWAVLLAGAFGIITFVLKLVRPGGALASLFGATAVVVPESSPHSVAGTATPEHVASP